jgi:hypothetical protein
MYRGRAYTPDKHVSASCLRHAVPAAFDLHGERGRQKCFYEHSRHRVNGRRKAERVVQACQFGIFQRLLHVSFYEMTGTAYAQFAGLLDESEDWAELRGWRHLYPS